VSKNERGTKLLISGGDLESRPLPAQCGPGQHLKHPGGSLMPGIFSNYSILDWITLCMIMIHVEVMTYMLLLLTITMVEV